jgi:hypothetical protein
MSSEKQIKASKEPHKPSGQQPKTTERQVSCRTKCRTQSHASQQNDRTTTILGETPYPPIPPTTFFIFLSNTQRAVLQNYSSLQAVKGRRFFWAKNLISQKIIHQKNNTMSSERNRIIQNLIQLNESIYYLSPNVTTLNRYKYKLKLTTVKRDKNLLQTLLFKTIHSVTVVNRFNRLEVSKNCFLTERSDVLEGLHILQPLIKLSQTETASTARELLWDIEDHGLLNEAFTLTQLKKLLKQRRATIKTRLYLLIESGHAIRVGGDKKNGYQYKIVKTLTDH